MDLGVSLSCPDPPSMYVIEFQLLNMPLVGMKVCLPRSISFKFGWWPCSTLIHVLENFRLRNHVDIPGLEEVNVNYKALWTVPIIIFHRPGRKLCHGSFNLALTYVQVMVILGSMWKTLADHLPYLSTWSCPFHVHPDPVR